MAKWHDLFKEFNPMKSENNGWLHWFKRGYAEGYEVAKQEILKIISSRICRDHDVMTCENRECMELESLYSELTKERTDEQE